MITIVTAYFKIKSKFPSSQYNTWMKNMLQNITTPMVIFTDIESEKMIKEYRGNYPTKIIVQKLSDFLVYRYWRLWNEHWRVDPENRYHTPELYMIWAEKSNFVYQVMKDNPFNSEWFFWSDIGAFRNRKKYNDIDPMACKYWPNYNKVVQLPKDKVLLVKTGDIKDNEKELLDTGLTKYFYKHTDNRIGGQFCLHINILTKWWEEYYNMLETFFRYGRFAGKDQTIMTNIFIKKPEMCMIIDAPPGYDKWFYFQTYFA